MNRPAAVTRRLWFGLNPELRKSRFHTQKGQYNCRAPLEMLRSATSKWPFPRGSSRLSAALSAMLLRGAPPTLLAKVGAGSCVTAYSREELGNPVFWQLYERPLRKFLRSFLRPGDVFVDIGAHRGWHATYALGLVSPEGAVIACEPFPAHAQHLRAIAHLNPGHRLFVEEVAVGRQEGYEELLTSLADDSIHTLIPEFTSRSVSERRAVRVATTTLDRVFEKYRHVTERRTQPTVVLKIDVEGAELDVLLGGAGHPDGVSQGRSRGNYWRVRAVG